MRLSLSRPGTTSFKLYFSLKFATSKMCCTDKVQQREGGGEEAHHRIDKTKNPGNLMAGASHCRICTRCKQCCGVRPFWYGSGVCFSLWYGSDPAFQFDPDPDPYRFKEVIYLKQYFLYIFTWFSLSVGPIGPTQKVFFVKFSLPVNFIVPLE